VPEFREGGLVMTQEHGGNRDHVIRVLAAGGHVLALAALTTGLVGEARVLHGTSPTATAALGRALTGGALMAALLKRGQRLALKIEGGGPLGKIIVEADRDGSVRGFVDHPEVELPARAGKIDVSGAVGRDGFLTVIKDLGTKAPYNGVVSLRTGEIAEDLAYYFAESEQIPTAMGLGVYVEADGAVGAAGGFLVQTMPPVEEEIVEGLIARIGGMDPVTTNLRRGASPEEILKIILGGLEYHVLEENPLTLRCNCDRPRIERVVLSLGEKEIASLIEDPGFAEVSCTFCRSSYRLEAQDLRRLLEEARGGREEAPPRPKR